MDEAISWSCCNTFFVEGKADTCRKITVRYNFNKAFEGSQYFSLNNKNYTYVTFCIYRMLCTVYNMWRDSLTQKGVDC